MLKHYQTYTALHCTALLVDDVKAVSLVDSSRALMLTCLLLRVHAYGRHRGCDNCQLSVEREHDFRGYMYVTCLSLLSCANKYSGVCKDDAPKDMARRANVSIVENLTRRIKFTRHIKFDVRLPKVPAGM